MTAGGFTVLLAGAQPDRAVLGALLCRLYNILPDEGAKMARQSWGIIGENMTEEMASSAAAQAAQSGFDPVIVPPSVVAQVPPALPVKKAEITPQSLRGCVAGIEFDVPWKTVYAIAAAPVKFETRQMETNAARNPAQDAAKMAVMAMGMLTIGMPISLGGAKKEEARETVRRDTVFTLDLLSSSDCPHARIVADAFDFSVLGAQKTYSSQANFRLLALQLAALAEKAAKNAGLSAMIESRPLVTLAYDTAELYERELRKMFLLHRAARLG